MQDVNCIVLFLKVNITDKIIGMKHPKFNKMTKFELSSPPRLDEFKNKIYDKKIFVIGGGFHKLYNEICSLSKDCTFLLKCDDLKPLDENGDIIENCEVTEWYVFWNDIFNKNKSSFLIKSLFEYMHGVPTKTDRNVFRGMIDYLGDDTRFESFMNCIENPPLQKEIFETMGKDCFTPYNNLIQDRINRSLRQIRHFNENELIVDISFCDFPEKETAFQLAEEKNGQAAIAVKLDMTDGNIMCKAVVFSSRGNAIDVCKYYFNEFSGTFYIAEGICLLSDFLNKLNAKEFEQKTEIVKENFIEENEYELFDPEPLKNIQDNLIIDIIEFENNEELNDDDC